jgi:hypothetical protein
MSSKKWFIAFVISFVVIICGYALFNMLVDPFGVFGDAIYDWYSYDMTVNPRAAKIAYLDKHKIYVMKLVDDGDKKEAINSDNLASIFSSLRMNYDLIFVDTAPCGVDSDALFIAQVSDGVLYVILQDTVRISKIQDGLDSLISTGSEILGCILNGAQTSIMGYGYYKAYNKYGYYKSYGRYGKYSKYGGKYGKYGKYGKTGEDDYGFSFEDDAGV